MTTDKNNSIIKINSDELVQHKNKFKSIAIYEDQQYNSGIVELTNETYKTQALTIQSEEVYKEGVLTNEIKITPALTIAVNNVKYSWVVKSVDGTTNLLEAEKSKSQFEIQGNDLIIKNQWDINKFITIQAFAFTSTNIYIVSSNNLIVYEKDVDLISALTVDLSNDNAVIPADMTDADDIKSLTRTQVRVYRGDADVSTLSTYKWSASSGATFGEESDETAFGSITALEGNQATLTVEISVPKGTEEGNITLAKTMHITRGAALVYNIVPSAPTINISSMSAQTTQVYPYSLQQLTGNQVTSVNILPLGHKLKWGYFDNEDGTSSNLTDLYNLDGTLKELKYLPKREMSGIEIFWYDANNTLLDRERITFINDGLTAYLTNPTIGFNAGADGKVIGASKTSEIKVRQGLTDITDKISSVIKPSTFPEGMEIDINDNEIKITVVESTLNADAASTNGQLEFIVKLDEVGLEIPLTLGWIKLVDGDSSIGTEYYQATSTNSAPGRYSDENTIDTAWKTTIAGAGQSITKPYLWNFERITYTSDKTPTDTEVSLLSSSPRGIAQIIEYYTKNKTGTIPTQGATTNDTTHNTAPSIDTNTWKTTRPSLEQGDYLYNFEVIQYSAVDAEGKNLYSWTEPAQIAYLGMDGKAIGSVTEYYARSKTETNQPMGSEVKDDNGNVLSEAWSTTFTAPNKDLPYLWNYEVSQYNDTNNTQASATNPVIIAYYTENGRSIKSIQNYYLINTGTKPTSRPAATAANEGSDANIWYKTAPKTTETNRFLWNSEIITYLESDGVTETSGAPTEPACIGTHGSGVKQIITYERSFTYAQWTQAQSNKDSAYTDIGHSELWWTKEGDSNGDNIPNTHIAVGDTAYLIGNVSDRFADADKTIRQTITIYGIVTKVKDSGITMTTSQVVWGGTHGTSGAALQVKYKNSATIPSTSDSGWQDTIPSPIEGQYLYMIQKLSNASAWSTPVQMSAKDGITPTVTIDKDNNVWIINGESTGIQVTGDPGDTPVITIEDGYWAIDGVKTTQKAQGETGKDGADIEYVYYRSETEQVNLTAPSYNNGTLTSGWTTSPQGITSAWKYEYVSIRTKPAGTNTNWTSFSTPVIWSKWGEKGQDGDGIEYKYYLSNSEIPPTYDLLDGWTDEPSGVSFSKRYEYVVQIKTTTTNDITTSTPSTPSLWAKWSEDGVDAYSISLSKESAILECDPSGDYNSTELQSITKVKATVMHGSVDISDNGIRYQWVPKYGVISSTNGRETFFTRIDADTATATLTVYKEDKSLGTKTFTVTKNKQIPGDPGETIYLFPSVTSITKTGDEYSPSNFTIQAMKKVGSNPPEQLTGYWYNVTVDDTPETMWYLLNGKATINLGDSGYNPNKRLYIKLYPNENHNEQELVDAKTISIIPEPLSEYVLYNDDRSGTPYKPEFPSYNNYLPAKVDAYGWYAIQDEKSIWESKKSSYPSKEATDPWGAPVRVSGTLTNYSDLYKALEEVEDNADGVKIGIYTLPNEKIGVSADVIKAGAINVGGFTGEEINKNKFYVDMNPEKPTYMAGWEITNTSIKSRNNLGVNDSFHMGTADLATEENKVSIGGSDARSDWRLGIGSNFGVTKDGEVYATAGKIGNVSIDNVASTKINSNLFIGSTNDDYWTSSVNKDRFGGTNGEYWITWDGTTGGGTEKFIYHQPFGVTVGKTYTLSFDAKKTENLSSSEVFILQSGFSSGQFVLNWTGFSSQLTQEYKRFSHTFTVPNYSGDMADCDLRFDHNGSINGKDATLWVRNIKLEEGTEATAWSLAPEDVATTAHLNVLNESINAKVANSQTNEEVNWSMTNKAFTVTAQDGMNTGGITVDKNGLTVKGTIEATGGNIDGVAIGDIASIKVNPNLLIGSHNNDYWVEYINGIGFSNLSGNSGEYYRAGKGFMYFRNGQLKFELGKTYTLSFDIKSDAPTTTTTKLTIFETGSKAVVLDATPIESISTTYQRLTKTFTVNNANGTANACTISFVYDANNQDILYIRNIKLEEGDKATAWSLAPEDNITEKQVTTITKDTISTETIIAKNLTAGYIQSDKYDLRTGTESALDFTLVEDHYKVGLKAMSIPSEVLIPEKYNGKPVTELDVESFAAGKDIIQKLAIPAGITTNPFELLKDYSQLIELHMPAHQTPPPGNTAIYWSNYFGATTYDDQETIKLPINLQKVYILGLGGNNTIPDQYFDLEGWYTTSGFQIPEVYITPTITTITNETLRYAYIEKIYYYNDTQNNLETQDSKLVKTNEIYTYPGASDITGFCITSKEDRPMIDSPNFKVEQDGTIYAKAGMIGRVAIDDIGIKAETIQSSNYEKDITGFKITSAEDENMIDSPNFKVTQNGEITANRGEIAGWQIAENGIDKEDADGNSMVGMSSGNDLYKSLVNNDGTSPIRFYAGGRIKEVEVKETITSSSQIFTYSPVDCKTILSAEYLVTTGGGGCSFSGIGTDTLTVRWFGSNNGILTITYTYESLNFIVLEDGSLYASAADITGNITATSGTFFGTLRSKNGELGPFQINDAGLVSDYVEITQQHVKFPTQGKLILGNENVKFETTDSEEKIITNGQHHFTISNYGGAGIKFWKDEEGQQVQRDVDIRFHVFAPYSSGSSNVTPAPAYDVFFGRFEFETDTPLLQEFSVDIGMISDYGMRGGVLGINSKSSYTRITVTVTVPTGLSSGVCKVALKKVEVECAAGDNWAFSVDENYVYYASLSSLPSTECSVEYNETKYFYGTDESQFKDGYFGWFSNIKATDFNGKNNILYSLGSFCPDEGKTSLLLGDDDHKWADISLLSGSKIGSDRRLKNSIQPLSDKYENFFDFLITKKFKYNEGTSNRDHIGFIAQEVEDALKNADITLEEFAGICIGKNEEQTRFIRYDEFVALNTWQIQKLKARMEQTEETIELQNTYIKKLEERLERLEQKLL